MRGTVRVSTYEVHRHLIEPHIVPALGRLKLKDLNPAHVRALYREKLDSGLSAATVRKMHSILRKALKQAVLDGLIPRNVCDAVKPPKVERKEITLLDRQQAKSLLEAASGDRLEALCVLAVHTGMRRERFSGARGWTLTLAAAPAPPPHMSSDAGHSDDATLLFRGESAKSTLVVSTR